MGVAADAGVAEGEESDFLVLSSFDSIFVLSESDQLITHDKIKQKKTRKKRK